MWVDPEQLRVLAGSMSDIGVGIEAIRTQADTSDIDVALPSSVLAQAGLTAGCVAAQVWSQMAAGWTEVATLVEASASRLQVVDGVFADGIGALGGVS
ncbi:hypothetical protein [Nocardia sp. NPDC059691]|uniref:hypothetical protein n=2 Tax=unclassified Nocardia TaxID=2637762 RepID=UPI0036B67692